MSFASLPFLFAFLPLALAGFAIASRLAPLGGFAWAIAASLAFYGCASPRGLPVVCGALLLNAWVMTRIAANTLRRIWWLTGGIALNLAFLVFGRMGGVPLPGASFIAFAQIGLLLDQRESSPIPASRSAFLVLFFPHVLSGPVLRLRDIAERLDNLRGRRFDGREAALGSIVFVIGLLKKTLLADPLASVVGPAFAEPSALSPLAAWTAALAWSFELYFDFSGYSDMAIGLARIFGVRFPENFDSPYKAHSVIDYWQRWHMTLTRFLTGTIYNPLALSLMRWCRRRWLGGRGPGFSIVGFAAGHTVPIVATMLAVGLWHGLTWTYAVFGLMHAGFLIANHVWRTIRPHAEPAGWMGPATYLCVLAGAIVFRAPDLSAAFAMFGAMTDLSATEAFDGAMLVRCAWLFGLGWIVWFCPNTKQIVDRVAERPVGWRVGALAGVCAGVGFLALGGTGEFVYFRF